ncbi:MAG: DUF6541 family protein, partial [Sciscionella sp.]
MSWWQLVPALGCAVLILFVPGYLVVRAWGMSGLVAAGAAAPISASIMAGSAVLGPFLGLRWSPLLPLWPTLVLGVLGLTARWSFPHWFAACKPSRRRPWRSRWTLLAHLGALAIPAVLITRGLITMIGAPENISQTYDAIFHLNAVRYILDSGSGSSLTLGGMYSNGAHPGFYPGAWHDVVSVVVQLSGASIPMATNAVVIAVGALVWPVAAIFLTTRVTGNKPAPVLLAGALAAGFGALPYLMVDFGVLYPMYLSLALLPSVLALASMAFAAGDRGLTPAWLAVLVLLGAIPGLALAHPSSFL